MHDTFELTLVTPSGEQLLRLRGADARQPLSEVLRRAGVPLNTRCGQKGLCDGCLVHVAAGGLTPLRGGEASKPGKQAVRACEYAPAAGARVMVPARSLLAYEPQVVANFKVNIPRAQEPLWQAVKLEPVPTSAGELCARVQAQVQVEGGVSASDTATAQLGAMQQLEALHAIVERRPAGWIITSLREEAPAPGIGVAIDIGTTTVAVALVELSTGAILHTETGFNRQMHLGDDVLTRINLCATTRDMLSRLQAAVSHDTIERLLLKAMTVAKVEDERIAAFAIAANTTMLHLLAGVDPTPMGHAPFTAPFLEYKVLPLSAVRVRLTSAPHPSAVPARAATSVASADPAVHLLPSVAAYVGADLTAGVLSSGLAYDEGPSLLVDVGTNGEIIFKQGTRMWAAATAAGPAFEGSRMASGMRAGHGAISHIRMTREEGELSVDCDVIGNVKPTGICGSAYVDFLAQARQVGLITETGRLVPEVAGERIAPFRDMGTAFTVALGHGGERIAICEGDIAALLQAKAAVAAGILTLLRQVNANPSQVRKLYLAGGFGMHLDIVNTIACGLLPGFRPEQVELVGNTSLAGAYLSLLDEGILCEIIRVAKTIEIVELNLDPEFEGTYIDQLRL
jgi:uncharacterized 2Fe-2S/4Fe-4S cluster protein (DUF4445 family)